MLTTVLDRREERAKRCCRLAAELTKRAAEADVRMKRLHNAIESGVADLSDSALKERVIELKATRDQAWVDAERENLRLS